MQPMKVKNLIKKLQGIPEQDSEVNIHIRFGVDTIKVIRKQVIIDSISYDDDHNQVYLNISED